MYSKHRLAESYTFAPIVTGLSNSNFFSEEDAASVKEMISNFSLNDTFKEELKQAESLKKKSKVTSNKKQRKPSKSAVEKNVLT